MNVLLVSDGVHEGSGALESLVQRVAPKIGHCTWEPISRKDIHAYHGKGQGFFKRAVRWIFEARKAGYDALVLSVDEDGNPERVDEITQAQDDQQCSLPRALGVAIRTFDAWMLADEGALGSILELTVDRQPHPEANANPKATLAGILQGSNCGLWQRELYAEVARTLALTRLEERCPRGFGVFAARLRQL